MMDGNENKTEWLSISKDLLECSVCLDRLDTSSKVLPCQHTFCRRCLEDIVSSHGDELRCPECRVLVNMKVDELPPNVLLMRILGGLNSEPVKETTDPSASVELKAAETPSRPRKSDTDGSLPTTPSVRPILGSHFPSKQQVPQNVCHAKALFDFQSNVTGDLAFQKDDVIELRRRIDQNWFYGHLKGRDGAFPVNHVQIIVPLPVPQCRAVFDFRMDSNDSDGCLSFPKGQVINVLRRIDQNWAEGRIGDCIGIFPINFVELNPLAKQLMGGESSTNRHCPDVGDVMTPVAAGPRPTAVAKSPVSYDTSIANRLPMPRPAEVVLTTSASGDATYNGARTGHTLSSPRPLVATRGHPDGVSSDNIVSAPPTVYTAASGTNRSKASGDAPRMQPYVAVFSYKPQKPDELELTKGAHYFVSERCQDGWLRGMNSSHAAGVFPGNHVVPLRDHPASLHHQPETGNNGSASRTNNSVVHPMVHPASPPVLPPRNQTSVTEPVNLIKRIANNLKRSKSPPANENSQVLITTPPRAAAPVVTGQSRFLQAAHGRSGSCPSQLLDLSAMKVSVVDSNKQGNKPGASLLVPNANAFGSHRVRGVKERPALHKLHRQLGVRKEDLTSLVGMHKKSNSLDARLIGVNSSPIDVKSDFSRSSVGPASSSNGQYQIKERFRCIVPYPPNSEYELGLEMGDIVLVNKKRENGWYRGVHQRSGKSGLFPASFVEPVVSSNGRE